ncbi:FAD/NAD(P)-binding domain-containing protein [Coemansia reversa NRRL 1564]|uniref:FAD/NAD(P)-binding domain-containing protein n=1 Tax=Coemansia reversa (strain ATCC 12441 / NRRL 1564) TaxID=763665 RepID=A0A2G5BGG2_COERN|nr:FAD/NAD(P)-binding domain-containing protein [Coemansia reversa NRRL 1564]|eukprot:PIA18062.1 FAD/NAD(P)-binding domain-containing protein [Coemansia reversa NRRL 1564]
MIRQSQPQDVILKQDHTTIAHTAKGHAGYRAAHGFNNALSEEAKHYSIDPSTVHLHTMNLARTSKIFHVVIIGGSFAGIRAAQDLEHLMLPDLVTITVIERRDKYFYNLGALRSMAKPELIDLVWLPYDNIFRYPHNKVVQGEVTSVYSNSVILKGGRKLDFDSLLVATGSIYPAPCKIDAASHTLGKAELRRYFEMVKVAESILIIGGGPTGIGLAAEIATAYPSKNIYLVHSGTRLLSTEHNSEGMSHKAYKKLNSLKIKIILNERVIIPDDKPLSNNIECRWLKTSKGRNLFSNLQFLCNGITFNTTFMDTLDPIYKHKIIDSKTQQIRVLPTMQINHPELPWIFSAGDVCNTSGEKQAYRADSQGAHVARCMARMAQAWINGDNRWFDVPLKQWHDPAQYMCVAMGPSAGVTETPWMVLGDLPTRIAKSRELFLARRYKEFNLEYPGISKRASRNLTTEISSSDIARIGKHNLVSTTNEPLHRSHNRHVRTRDAVATDLNGKAYDLSKAVARLAISEANHIDDRFNCDRVSLSRTKIHGTARNDVTYPYQKLYGHYEVDSDADLSDGYSTDENVGDIDGPGSPAMLYRQTAPRSNYSGSSSNCSQHMLMANGLMPPNPSSISVNTSTSTDTSSAVSRTPSITSTLLYGPVIPRQAKDRHGVGKPSLFKSHQAIDETLATDSASALIPPVPRKTASYHPLVCTSTGSTATINLEQYN